HSAVLPVRPGPTRPDLRVLSGAEGGIGNQTTLRALTGTCICPYPGVRAPLRHGPRLGSSR
ncbi:MAG: hypothetical protein ACE5JO_10730, partial [Candidatus Binatia bacterium]